MNHPPTKARQTILFICKEMRFSKNFGSIVLNKALYYIDRFNYLETGKTVTGFGYVKQVYGPTPNPAEFLKLCEDMLKKKEISQQQIPNRLGRFQKCTIAETEPNMNIFTPQEVALMYNVIEILKGHPVATISEFSHQSLAWEVAEQMEELPPFTFLLKEAELTQSDLNWGDQVIAVHKAA